MNQKYSNYKRQFSLKNMSVSILRNAAMELLARTPAVDSYVKVNGPWGRHGRSYSNCDSAVREKGNGSRKDRNTATGYGSGTIWPTYSGNIYANGLSKKQKTRKVMRGLNIVPINEKGQVAARCHIHRN